MQTKHISSYILLRPYRFGGAEVPIIWLDPVRTRYIPGVPYVRKMRTYLKGKIVSRTKW